MKFVKWFLITFGVLAGLYTLFWLTVFGWLVYKKEFSTPSKENWFGRPNVAHKTVIEEDKDMAPKTTTYEKDGTIRAIETDD